MKITLLFLTLFSLHFITSAQDIITYKNGNQITAKVLEITPTEIKYKRFDNLSGPTYTINKNEVSQLRYENGIAEEITSVESNQSTIPNSIIYLLRKTGYSGSMAGYQVFIDEKVICKLNNKKYIIREIPPGKHYFSVQFYGANSKNKAEKLEINTEPGKTYYVKITQNSKIYAGDTFCVQILEDEAKLVLANLEIDPDCQ